MWIVIASAPGLRRPVAVGGIPGPNPGLGTVISGRMPVVPIGAVIIIVPIKIRGVAVVTAMFHYCPFRAGS
jgi:hypothetical protein